jgi:hypothetical protein
LQSGNGIWVLEGEAQPLGIVIDNLNVVQFQRHEALVAAREDLGWLGLDLVYSLFGTLFCPACPFLPRQVPANNGSRYEDGGVFDSIGAG